MKTFILTFTIAIQSIGLFSQINKHESQTANIDSIVSIIKNNISNYKQKINKWSDSSNHVQIIYRQKKTIKFSSLTYRENNLNKKTDYYFNKGQLIFAEFTWKNDSSKIVYVENFYRTNGHLIQWIINDKKIDIASKEFKNMDKQLIDISKSWAKQTK